MSPTGTTPPHSPRCRMCGKPVAAEYAPFCSPRCKDADLGHWFSEAYAIAGATMEEDETFAANDNEGGEEDGA